MSLLFDHYPSEPDCQQCRNAYTLLCNAHDTSSSFLEIFNTTTNEIFKVSKIFLEEVDHKLM